MRHALPRVAGAVLAVIVLGALLSTAGAQGFPSKPVKIVVPTGAGGITDIIARIVAHKLTETWGQQVIVDNRPGAGGMIGSDAVAKAAPDGHTLLMVFPSHPVNPSLYAKLPYDTVKDFAPVTMVTTVTLALIVNPAVPAKSVPELVALAKAQPGKLNYGAVGTGSLGHLAAEVFKSTTGVNLVHVPYKGAPQAAASLLSNETQLFFDALITAIPQVKAGKVRVLAVTSPRRHPSMPDVPAMAEAGVAGYDVTGWNGILAPAGTPREIVAKLHADIVRVLRMPDVRERLSAQGADPVGNTPEEFGAIIRHDVAKWAKVVKDAGIKVE